jgi:hypothetical protein
MKREYYDLSRKYGQARAALEDAEAARLVPMPARRAERHRDLGITPAHPMEVARRSGRTQLPAAENVGPADRDAAVAGAGRVV